MSYPELLEHTERDLAREEFWRAAFPELHLSSLLRDGFELNEPVESAASAAAARMRLEGYFQARDEALVPLTHKLSRGVGRCVELGIPPIFIFLFDEAWAAFYRQHRMLSTMLGPDYKMLPDFWAWHVDPRGGEAGWRPHRDKGHASLSADGEPLSLTVWIPLTEATPLNGCMYVLPANRDPVYGTQNDKSWQIDLPSIRALPGAPGDIFVWSQALLHWGAQSSPFAEQPRMSMALEFQRGDAVAFNQPLMTALRTSTFGDRMKLISKQILQYDHMYPLTPEMRDLAQGVLSAH